ncbi:MAG: DUF3516 domain-containing protein, partial [Microthrixaceae bacterium]|nr:DUF3516 domain-containing protein [Microthrixaceae bacterium]
AGERSVYTAPIKALVSEKFFQLREALGDDAVGMMTGDATINPDAPVICATAEILAHQALGGTPGGAPSHVTMDEFHYYDEPDRGWAWQVPLLELPDTRFLAMSATLGDVGWLADDLTDRTSRSIEVVTGVERPVPLSFEYRTTPLTETVEDLVAAEQVPAYVVHFTQQAATEQAQAFTSLSVLTKAERQELAELLATVRFDTPFGKDLKRFLSHGVGVHHAGLLPRYRLLVERLAKEGWLRLICGTDTLGVGVNIPIRTVLFTQLYKYDGVETRILTAREFAQVAGRAGRRGYDTEGYVVAQAPPHVVENLRAERKAGTNTAKLRKIVKKKPPERGYAHWNRDTFERLTTGTPEQLNSRMSMTHSMVLHVLSRPGDGEAALARLIDGSHESAEAKAQLSERAAAIIASLEEAEILDRSDAPDADGRLLVVRGDLQADFALDRPLAPFVVEVVDSYEPDDPDYALSVLSVVEASLDDPRQILVAQQRKARDEAYTRMKMEGVDFDERQERLAEIRWPQPLRDELLAMLATFSEHHPWVTGELLRPKAVARGMYEAGLGFRDFVTSLGVKRSEGVLLRYLTEVYRTLQRNVPEQARTEELEELTAWVGSVIRQVDSSLLEEYDLLEGALGNAGGAEALEGAAIASTPPPVTADARAFRAMVRTEVFRWVQSLARHDHGGLSRLVFVDGEQHDLVWWRDLMEPYWEEWDSIGIDADARSARFLKIDEHADHWDVTQWLVDPEETNEWSITARVDLRASDEAGEAIVAPVRIGHHPLG